jgi:cell division transport system permease protein
LPIPRLIIVHMQAGHRDDFEPLRAALAAGAPAASLDDHRLWLSRLDVMAGAIVVFAAALFALMIVAMGTAVGFATRGAMAGAREIVEVLHFVGAADSYIADQFQGHFFRLGLRGATIGGGAAAAFFAVAALVSFVARRTSAGAEIAALVRGLPARPARLRRDRRRRRRDRRPDRRPVAPDRLPSTQPAAVNARPFVWFGPP